MRIVKIEIECFGCLRDLTVEPAPGLTLIEGENESGKSTLLAFLRFALYGFPRRGGADGEERDKRLTRDGRTAAGSLTLACERGQFRITRRAYLRTSGGRETLSEELAVLHLPLGERVALEGKSPGEYFLGLPPELYEGSLCSVQSGADRVCAPGVGAAMGELLFAGEHSLSTQQALNRLALAQRELQHLKGRGGRVPELEDRLSELDGAVAHHRVQQQRLTELRTQMDARSAQLKQERAELSQLADALEGAEIDRTLSLFDDKAAALAQEREIRARIEHTERENGGLPTDSSFIQRAGGLLRDLLDRRAELSRIGAERERLRETARTSGRGRPLVLLCVLLLLLAGAAAAAGLWQRAWLLPCLVVAGLFTVAAVSLVFFIKKQKLSAADVARSREVEAAWVRAQDAANGVAASLHTVLEPVGQSDLAVDPDGLTAYLARVSAYQAAHAESHAAAVRELERAAGVAQMLTRRLEGWDESALRARRAALPTLQGAPEGLRARQSALSASVQALEQTLAREMREEAALSAKAQEPLEAMHERERVRAELEAARRRLAAVCLARDAMERAAEELRCNVTPHLAQEAGRIFAELTVGQHGALYLSSDFGITLEEDGIPRPLSHFSAGCRDLVYLSLRFALLRTLSHEPLPLLLDEALATLDDRRAQAMLTALLSYCREGGQCLLLTCHAREGELLAHAPDVKRMRMSGG